MNEKLSKIKIAPEFEMPGPEEVPVSQEIAPRKDVPEVIRQGIIDSIEESEDEEKRHEEEVERKKRLPN